MTLTIQIANQSWVYCFAWINRDVSWIDESAPDEVRFGLHSKVSNEATSDDIEGIEIEWDREGGLIMHSYSDVWWTWPYLSETLRYLTEHPDTETLTPQQFVDFLLQRGYQDVTDYRDDSLLEGIVKTVSGLSDLKLSHLQRLLFEKCGYVLEGTKKRTK